MTLPFLLPVSHLFCLFFSFFIPLFFSIRFHFLLSALPLSSTSCSAEISAETPVRLSGDQHGGCDITAAPSVPSFQPSAVAMATSATACRPETGDEPPAGGAGTGGEGRREEAGECVRIFFFFLNHFYYFISTISSPCLLLLRLFDAVFLLQFICLQG